MPKNPPPAREPASDRHRENVPTTRHRRAQITAWIEQHGAERVGKLAERFRVSEVTIRSDLEQLEKAGQLIRDHGGAMANPTSRHLTSLMAVEQRAHLNIKAKRVIARLAARLVRPGDTIIMDAGTTVVEMIPHLVAVPALTIVTNALNVALQLGATTSAQVIFLGGSLNRESSSMLGPLAEQMLRDLVVPKVFLGTQALSLEHGLTDTTIEIAQIKRAMIRSADQVILLSDSTKWGRTGFIKVAPLTAVHTFVCDSDLSAEARLAVRQLGIELIVE